MRVLHARYDSGIESIAGRKSRPERGGIKTFYARQYLPLHRLQENHRVDHGRRQEDARCGLRMQRSSTPRNASELRTRWIASESSNLRSRIPSSGWRLNPDVPWAATR